MPCHAKLKKKKKKNLLTLKQVSTCIKQVFIDKPFHW